MPMQRKKKAPWFEEEQTSLIEVFFSEAWLARKITKKENSTFFWRTGISHNKGEFRIFESVMFMNEVFSSYWITNHRAPTRNQVHVLRCAHRSWRWFSLKTRQFLVQRLVWNISIWNFEGLIQRNFTFFFLCEMQIRWILPFETVMFSKEIFRSTHYMPNRLSCFEEVPNLFLSVSAFYSNCARPAFWFGTSSRQLALLSHNASTTARPRRGKRKMVQKKKRGAVFLWKERW